MEMPAASLAKICSKIREHVEMLGTSETPTPIGWNNVDVSLGAPGINLKEPNDINRLNLFFYRFEPFGFAADALPSDVLWIKVICLITAIGTDERTTDSGEELSAGLNELHMLSHVMRLFQEQPVMMLKDESVNTTWNTQFILRPLSDEQINQIWSSQGGLVYRPSIAYEIALAPIEPELQVTQAALVGSTGTYSSGNIDDKYLVWPLAREIIFPVVTSSVVNTNNPQWAPIIAMVTGVASERQASISINFTVPVSTGGGTLADFTNFPEIDVLIAGDRGVNSNGVIDPLANNKLYLVGQILQNPSNDRNNGEWKDILVAPLFVLTPDAIKIDVDNLPNSNAINFVLNKDHWTEIDNSNNSWQLQIFVERNIKLDPVNNSWVDVAQNEAGIKIRSNPLLITITRDIE